MIYSLSSKNHSLIRVCKNGNFIVEYLDAHKDIFVICFFYYNMNIFLLKTNIKERNNL